MYKSVVEYNAGHEDYRLCPYCKSCDTCLYNGLQVIKRMAPIDYQNLIDRGWISSGKYLYKPTMDLTCCPSYAMRCDTKKFILTKSQKKVLKKVHKFLATGKKPQTSQTHSITNDSDPETDVSEFSPNVDMQSSKRITKVRAIKQSDAKGDNTETAVIEDNNSGMQNQTCDTPSSDPRVSSKSSQSLIPPNNPSLPFKTSNFNGPYCRKAKEIRREKRLEKLLKRGLSQETAAANVTAAILTKKGNEPKSLEEFLSDPLPPQPAHKLEIIQLRLVPTDLESELFMATFKESHKLYVKYQMAIHGQTAEECNEEYFKLTLIDTPFEVEGSSSSSRNAYGSFHHQYWLDDKLIAVGVLDILPYCVSSSYFFHDPDYKFLSLGTYSALIEIALTRELNTKYQDLQYYSMGYYVHSCTKMRYKEQFVPSFLLCPETYIFQPIEKCLPKLDHSEYHRLEEDPKKEDIDGAVNMSELLILYYNTKMTFNIYKNLNVNIDEEEVKEYAQLVGRKCYRKMMLQRYSFICLNLCF